MRLRRALVTVTLLAGTVLHQAAPLAETPRTFEVVSLKPSKEDQPGARWRILPGGRVEFRNTPLSTIIFIAYQLQVFSQVDGLPDWTQAERYDIDAKAEIELPSSVWAPDSPLHQMLQSMLADRSKLAARTERRRRPIYSLVKARSDGRLGPQLMRSGGDCVNTPAPPPAGAGAQSNDQAPRCGIRAAIGYYAGRAVPLQRVADYIASALGRPVVDNTGLRGDVDFELRFRLEPPPGAAAVAGAPLPSADDPAVPTLTTAVQEQLGLKVVSATAAVDVLVIEHVERPSLD
jgi:bla regulator protein blaR1